MKKSIVLFIALTGFVLSVRAQRLSPEAFKEKKQIFITEQAELSKEEAAKFFPLYFELQNAKKKLNDESLDLMRKGKNEATTEAEYEAIVERLLDNRIAADRLDKSYLDKFKKILSYKQIYRVQRAEMYFHREMLKGMRHERRKGEQASRQQR
ncbi:hypothetical protein [Bacteroides heparinolyticus]|uniref:hypothetical protein n=1 Tax=Prevotella heparinolytica TaxID=28113 RepID=UPI0035A01854